MARINFPGAVEILDYYHAREYLTEIVEILFGKKSEQGARQLERWKDMFFEDEIEQVIQQARALAASMTGDAQLARMTLDRTRAAPNRTRWAPVLPRLLRLICTRL